MAEKYLEKISAEGYIIRVNLIKGSFMIFKDNQPVQNPKSKTQSIVHELPQIIFLGKEFELKLILPERVGFFDVSGNQIFIPFWIKGVSDVRHVKLPSYVNSDLLPVYVYHFQSFHFGSIPASLSGMNYFVVDSRIDREMLIRLKMHFPLSRIIVYRGEQDALVQESNSLDASTGVDNVRAADLSQSDDRGLFSKNPSFLARVYLRKLEFTKMYELPYKYQMDQDIVETILAYLNIMIQNSDKKQELRQILPDTKKLKILYEVLSPFLSFDVANIEQFFDQGLPDQSVLQIVRDILRSQNELYRTTKHDPKKERFFDNGIAMIDPLL